MRRLPTAAVFAIAIASASLAGCTPPSHVNQSSASPGRTISEETIAGYAVTNAWEVLRRTGYFRVSRDDGPGSDAAIRSRRGRTSLLLAGSDVLRVMIDGAPVADLRLLRNLPANSIAWIQVLNGIDGTTLEGTNSGGGLILIVTKAGG